MRWSYLVTEKEKGPETILIVDDDSEIREILRILLCRNGFIVKEAADAKEALLKLDSSIDLIFCWAYIKGYECELQQEVDETL